MAEIKTIILDLSEVYLRGIVGSHTLLEKQLGVAVGKHYFYNESFEHYILGKITEDDYWQTILVKHSWDIAIERLKQAARKNFREIKGTREIIERLQDRGYKLMLLSNHGKEWVEYCNARYDYHKLFKHVIYSFQIQQSKPNKKIFKHVLTDYYLNPKECLFIDDNVNNILAAKSLKIQSVQFKSAKQLQRELSKLHIEI